VIFEIGFRMLKVSLKRSYVSIIVHRVYRCRAVGKGARLQMEKHVIEIGIH